MVRKRGGKKVEEDVDRLEVGRDDIPEGSEVGIYRTEAGGIMMLPVAMARRLKSHQAEVLGELQQAVSVVQQAQRDVDALVPELRSMGVPWSMIAWATGLTEPGARKRWAVDRDRP